MTILVVDNEKEIGNFFAKCLTDRGYSCRTVSSGYEAIDLIEKEAIQCVVTDYRMTQGDGISLSHFCANRGLPCIVITAFRTESVAPYLAAGIPVFDKGDIIRKANIGDLVDQQIRECQKSDSDLTTRVLLVDDDHAELHLLQRLFRNYKAQTYEIEWT